MKFRNTIDLLKNCVPDNLLTIAVEAGYYDLSHFNKEIRQLSGNILKYVPSSVFPLNTQYLSM